MKKISYFILTLISVFCLTCMRAKDTDTHTNLLFEKYLLAFEKQKLPFKMDRNAVFEMVNNSDVFFEIKDSLILFLPDDLINNQPNSKFRGMYLLPEYADIILVLVFQEFIDEYDTRVVKNYLISHDKTGLVIDYQELAGVLIDVCEAYLEIFTDFTVNRRLYQRRMNNSKNEIEMMYASLLESFYEYSVSKTGLIEETKRTAREGYFELDLTGYSFVKPLKND